MNLTSIVRNAALGLALALAHGMTAAPALAADFNHAGIGLKIGENTGLLGLQLSANLTPDLQINAGWGTTALAITTDESNDFTFRSLFAAAKYYYGGWYASTGYVRKAVTVETTVDGQAYSASRAEHGIPLHAGYEFGGRTGFYTTVSAGYLAVLGGGDKEVRAGTATQFAETNSAASGVSIGLGLGYYLF